MRDTKRDSIGKSSEKSKRSISTKPAPKQALKQAPKQAPKQALKQAPKQNPKPTPKQEPKPTLKNSNVITTPILKPEKKSTSKTTYDIIGRGDSSQDDRGRINDSPMVRSLSQDIEIQQPNHPTKISRDIGRGSDSAPEGSIRIDPDLWIRIPMNAHIYFIARDMPGKFQSGIVRKVVNDSRGYSLSIAPNLYSKESLLVPLSDIVEIWKKYNYASQLELSYILDELGRATEKIKTLESKLKK